MSDNHKGDLILIVDDIPTNLKVLAKTLSNAGFEIAVATNGAMAIEQIQLDPPDLILLDILMPGMDGFDTCERLKTEPATADIPIIFMTALTDPVDKVKALSLGAVDYITKPFQEEEVLARVRVHLQLRFLTQSLQEKNQQLSEALERLQQMQKQAIAQEKLAVMGALTAGVAHEVRNPLNFINNYAEGSVELCDELKAEIETQAESLDRDAFESIAELIAEIRENAASIHRHGERADQVLQHMLLQARAGSNELELTDLNTLIDRSVDLAYKSKRSHDYRFAIEIKKDYDSNIGRLSVVRSDFSRALINLVDNACYALQAKQNAIESQAIDPNNPYTPTLWVKTEKQGDSIEIRIRDNGIGIEPSVREQIFQPFFTSKPIGEGTGLGLSMTYDIAVKQHGGAIEFVSEPGAYTEFILTLPYLRPNQ